MQGRIAQLEASNRAFADQIMEKQDSLEKAIAARNSYKLQLENSQQRCESLEQQVVELTRANNAELDIEFGAQSGYNFPKEGLRSRAGRKMDSGGLNRKQDSSDSSKSKGLMQAVNLIDQLGVETSTLLRRKPVFRKVLVIYIIVLHLWTMFVIYHFGHAHHSGPLPSGANGKKI
jgi:hypothetical protein